MTVVAAAGIIRGRDRGGIPRAVVTPARARAIPPRRERDDTEPDQEPGENQRGEVDSHDRRLGFGVPGGG